MRTIKFWTGLGLAAVSTSLMAENSAIAGKIDPLANAPIILAAAGEGGEGGGEGGQSKSSSDDVEFLTDLGVFEGHFIMGMELHQRGDKDAAVHLKLAKDEAYKELEPALQARKLPGFERQLAELIAVVETSKQLADMDKPYGKVANAIKAARKSEREASAIAAATQRLVRHAADEYAEGVKEGKIVDLKDYQNAWGLVAAARQMMAGLSPKARKRNKAAVTEIESELAKLKPVWPDLAGKLPLTADPTLLPAAASRIELTAASIK